MNTSFKCFSFRIAVLSIAVSILSFWLYDLFPKWITSNWYYLVVFFITVNLVLYKLFDKSKQKNKAKFNTFFTAATFLKPLLYFAVIAIYLFINKEDAIPFLITFFGYYVVYTAVEVLSIVKTKKHP